MANLTRTPIIIKETNYTLKESYTDSSGDTIWIITEPNTKNVFHVHTSSSGKLYLSFFKGIRISSICAQAAIKKICEILLEQGLNPTINIHYTNQNLIKLCCQIGFRKNRKIKHQYYLKTLK